MADSLAERMQNDFLNFLREILTDKDQIDIAVRDRAGPRLNEMPVGISTLEAAGVFDEKGELIPSRCTQANITIHNLPRFKLDIYRLETLSLRERLILDSAISSAHNKLMSKYKKNLEDLAGSEDLDALTSFKDIFQETPKVVIRELRSTFYDKDSKLRLMTNSNSYELFNPVLQSLNQGFYHFKDTNVLISPGPQTDTEETSHKKLSRFYSNLGKNNVKHVFAIGRILPYHPREGIGDRAFRKDTVVNEDFSNYFIPDSNGRVRLPLPEYEGFEIKSNVVEKVGRISTYEITINGGAPVQIHHLPLQDKQPLELTDQELAYVQNIQQKVPADQNILTHCHGGKGRSAQMAYILASNTDKYSKNKGQEARGKEQLAEMRLEKCGDASSSGFVETSIQETYLSGLENKLYSSEPAPIEKMPPATLDRYILLNALFVAEIDRLKAESEELFLEGGTIKPTASLTSKQSDYVKLLELYQDFQGAKDRKEMFEILKSAQELPSVSSQFKDIRKNDPENLFKDQLGVLLNESLKTNTIPVNRTIIYDVAARNLSYSTAEFTLSNLMYNEKNDTIRKENKQSGIDLQIARMHLLQGYLRQYKQFSPDKQAECAPQIAGSLKALTRDAYSELAEIKTQFEQNKNSSLLVSWRHYQERIAVLKETVALYENSIGEPLVSEGQPLRKNIEELEQIVDAGIDKTVVQEDRIGLAPGYQAPLSSKSVMSVQNAKKSIRKMKQVHELWQKVENQVRNDIEHITEPDKLIEQASTAVFWAIKDYGNRSNTVIKLKESRLEDLSKEIESLEPLMDLKSTRSKVLTLISRAFSEFEEQYNMYELYAKEAEKAAIASTERKTKINKNKAEDAQVLLDIATETAFSIANVASAQRAEKEVKKDGEDLVHTGLTSANVASVQSDEKEAKKDRGDLVHTGFTSANVASAQRDEKEAKKDREDLVHTRLTLVDNVKVGNEIPTAPKMVIFDVDDTLVDLDKGGIKNKEILFKLLRKIKNTMPDTEIAICTNRTIGIDGDPLSNGGYPLSRLIDEIRQETGVVIKESFQLRYSPDIESSIVDIIQELEAAHIANDQEAVTRIGRLIQGKNYQLDELRARYKEMYGELPKESECVFVDDSQSIYDQTVETTNYTAVKATHRNDPSVAYLVDLGYKTGVYSPLIRFLQGKNQFLNTDGIPNFAELGFKHTPIVRHVALEDFYKIIGTLPGAKNKNKVDEYKYDYTLSAIEQFNSLSNDFQNKTAMTAFNYMADEMKRIQDKMISLAQQPESNLEATQKEWTQLSQQIDKLIALEKQYAKHIGTSYLDMDLHRMQTLLRSDIKELEIKDLDGVKSLELPEPKARQFSQLQLLSAEQANRVSPLSLGEDTRYKTQRQQYLTQLSGVLEQKCVQMAEKYAAVDMTEWAVITKDNYKNYSDFSNLFSLIEQDIKGVDFDEELDAKNIGKLDNQLMQLKLLLTELKTLSSTATFLDRENKNDDKSYSARLAGLVQIVDDKTKELHNTDQYKAMMFLERAEKYIHSPDRKWNTGFQWNKHTLKGTDIAIPAHVAKQLAEVQAAKADGDYVKHRDAFIDIGQSKAKSFFSFLSSKASIKYASLFAKSEDKKEVIESLDEEFSNKGPGPR